SCYLGRCSMASHVTEHPAPLDLSPIGPCLHRRLIDEVLTVDGKPHGPSSLPRLPHDIRGS
ncbi:hypothetical protein, partial [Petrachloros mirabilis]